MARARCKKCGSSALTVEGCRTLMGSRAVRCLQCGWHLFDPRDGAGMNRKLSPEDFAPKQTSQRQRRIWVPCLVRGCPNRVDSDRNKSGLCQRHKCQLTQWENGKRTLPAPLQRMADGSYVVVREQQRRGAAR